MKDVSYGAHRELPGVSYEEAVEKGKRGRSSRTR